MSTYMYWVKTDDDGEPDRLYRENVIVDVWHQGTWRRASLLLMDLEGLGGSADYRTIAASDVERVLPRLKRDLNH